MFVIVLHLFSNLTESRNRRKALMLRTLGRLATPDWPSWRECIYWMVLSFVSSCTIEQFPDWNYLCLDPLCTLGSLSLLFVRYFQYSQKLTSKVSSLSCRLNLLALDCSIALLYPSCVAFWVDLFILEVVDPFWCSTYGICWPIPSAVVSCYQNWLMIWSQLASWREGIY